MKELKITTPVFHGIGRDPARLAGEEPGWIDPTEVCSITSGVEAFPKIQDVRKPKGENTTGKILSVINFRGGCSVLVVGEPSQIIEYIRSGIKGEVVEEK